jgi:hypothetical protein
VYYDELAGGLYNVTLRPEKPSASIFRAEDFYTEDYGSRLLRNVYKTKRNRSSPDGSFYTPCLQILKPLSLLPSL